MVRGVLSIRLGYMPSKLLYVYVEIYKAANEQSVKSSPLVYNNIITVSQI